MDYEFPKTEEEVVMAAKTIEERETTVSPAIDAAVRHAVADGVARAKKWGAGTMPTPTIHYFRGAHPAGASLFKAGKHELWLSKRLLEEYQAEMLRETIPHELTHMAITESAVVRNDAVTPFMLIDNNTHGPLWASAMLDIYGVEPRDYAVAFPRFTLQGERRKAA